MNKCKIGVSIKKELFEISVQKEEFKELFMFTEDSGENSQFRSYVVS